MKHSIIQVSGQTQKKRPINFRALLMRRFREMMDEALKYWVKRAVKNVRVDTGMSAYSFVSLAQRLKIEDEVLASIKGIGPKKPGHKKLYGIPVPAGNISEFKEPSVGYSLGRETGRVKLARGGFIFTFDVVVLQHYIHEDKWKSLEKADRSFEWYIKTHWRKHVGELEKIILG